MSGGDAAQFLPALPDENPGFRSQGGKPKLAPARNQPGRRLALAKRRGAGSRRRPVLGVDRNVLGEGRDPVDPRRHGRIRPQIEAAFVRDVRVRVERDVRKRGTAADEEPASV